MPFGRLERRTPAAPFSDINLTPLIDVMLVLLVVFIVTAPLLAARLPLQLPRTGAAAPAALGKAMTLEVSADGQVRLDGAPVDDAQWAARLRAAAQQDPALELHLRADERVPYGRVAQVMAAAREAGLARIGFAVQSPTRP